MKKILIITPHFPPSNLAAVHRSRLFAQHLPSFGWEPVILTVDEKYYEETLDRNLEKLLPGGLRIEKAKAFAVTRPRLVGDIGLRAFFQLYYKAKKIIREQQIDFVYIPIPSFYPALLGRWLHASTRVRYGIDYIDPWVFSTPRGKKLFSRHWLSERLANWLEPIAVKKASLITGVAEGYYDGVKQRNPRLQTKCLFGAMPYGGEKADHETIKQLQIGLYVFSRNPQKIQLVYAGAMLPKAFAPLEAVLKAIQQNDWLKDCLEIHFIGTGKTPDDPQGHNIKPLAERYGLWQKVIFEHPKRIPYLDVLVHLEAADGVFILGSTEPHYTPSKVYQAVLSKRPILAVLHKESTAIKVIREANIGLAIDFDGEEDIQSIENNFANCCKKYLQLIERFDRVDVNMSAFDSYSAKSITKKLVTYLDKIFENGVHG